MCPLGKGFQKRVQFKAGKEIIVSRTQRTVNNNLPQPNAEVCRFWKPD